MLVMIGLWVILAVLEAREGNFHGLMLDCCCPPGGRRGSAGGTKFYCAQDGITAVSAILKVF